MPARRAAALVATAFALAACASLPRFGGAEEPAAPATSYKLTDREVADVKSGFSAALTDGRTPIFGPIDARRTADGEILVCGLVRLRRADGRESGMKLFDGRAELDPFGALRFEPRRLSGVRGKFLDIYTDCRSAGALKSS